METDPGAVRATDGSGDGRADSGDRRADSADGRAAKTPPRLLAMFDGRSPNPTTCPFLRSEADGELAVPVEAPDSANRCAALDEPQRPSARQQQLVCLTTGHVECPRYLRGAFVARQMALSIPRARTLTGAIFGAILVLIASTAASFAFVVTRGGLDLPVASAQPSVIAAAPTQAPTPMPTVPAVVPSPVPSISLAPSPTPSPTLSPSPTPSPTPEPTPEPTPKPTSKPQPPPTPRPTSDRFAVLDPCPNRPNCWIYTIRSGDNLYSIAHWFGVSLERIYQLNPWARTEGIRAGQKLLIPTPTR